MRFFVEASDGRSFLLDTALGGPCASSDVYSGAVAGYVAYDVARDDPSFDAPNVLSVSSDGGAVVFRELEEGERKRRVSAKM